MADTHLHVGDFWLPSEFLSSDDLLMDKPNLTSVFGTDSGSKLSSAASSPVESETDDEDLFAALSRRLARATLLEKSQKINSGTPNFENLWVGSNSPKSTLSAAGSWSGAASNGGSPNGPSQFPSPPTTPAGTGGNDSLDLIYAAAGQVARLKMNSEGPGNRLLDHARTVAPLRNSSPAVENPNSSFYSKPFLSHANYFDHARLNQEGSLIWGRRTRESFFSEQSQLQQLLMSQNRVAETPLENNNPRGFFPTTAFPPAIRSQTRRNPLPEYGGAGARAVNLPRSGVKRECAGTGVFLPRRYDNPPEPPRKKPGCSAAALLPARNVQPLNNNMDHMASQTHPQACFNGTFAADYGNIMIPKRAIPTQRNWVRRPDASRGHEFCLPQEWTY